MPNGRDSHRVSGVTLFPEEHSSFENCIERMDIPYEEPAEEDVNRDIEKAPTAESPVKPAEEQKDPNLIGWDGPDDKENPMNWYDIQAIVTALS